MTTLTASKFQTS